LPRWLYTVLLYVASPLIFLRLWLRGRATPAYRLRWRERLGHAPEAAQALALTRPIWLHAVSLGEALASQPLVEAIREHYPAVPLLITTMTPTGSAQVRAIWGDDRVDFVHVYAPYDFPHAVRRFLAQWQPRALVIMETELWPNTLVAARARGIPVMLANARLSARSARGYERAGRLGVVLMRQLSVVAAQDEATAERFCLLGVPSKQVVCTGSVKFDLVVPSSLHDAAACWRVAWSLHQRPVWVAASTHAGEDEVVLAAHQSIMQAHPEALLILVPRHPERFDAVARLIASENMTVVRRSSHELVTEPTQVLLADSMGELLLWLAMAKVAFVGGSLLAPGGGHNTLEPLAVGVSTLTGPYFTNFQSINETFIAAGALAVVTDAASLTTAVLARFDDAELLRAQREAGQAVMAANQGAVGRQLQLLAPWLGEGA
jgi:3-deoxy-D-manno-octulosonic-acid transferase